MQILRWSSGAPSWDTGGGICGSSCLNQAWRQGVGPRWEIRGLQTEGQEMQMSKEERVQCFRGSTRSFICLEAWAAGDRGMTLEQ